MSITPPVDATVKANVRRVVAAVLRLPDKSLADTAAINAAPNWDSLAQLDILAAVEQEFSLTIGPDQAVDLGTLASLIEFVERHAP